ncbi:MAG: hypothetical protein V2A79_18620 [Planctomycetota bacterium]
MTTVGIHKQSEGFPAKWAEFLESRGAQVRWLDLLGTDPLEQVRGCDGVMWHWAHYPHEERLAARPILQVIETELGIPVFPDLRTAWHYDDKIAQAYLLQSLGLSAPKTWVFWRRQDAEKWAGSASYPVVAKLAVGAGSSNVKLIRDACEAWAHIARMFSRTGIIGRGLHPGKATLAGVAKDIAQRILWGGRYMLLKKYPPLPKQYWMPQKGYALFQEFLSGNEFDTRITVIGDRAFGFRRMNRPGDFRASGSGVIDHDPSQVDRRCVELAFEAAPRLRSQSMAFDILFAGPQREPTIVEISYCYADWAVEQCPGHWDRSLQWHEGRMWPEEAHVIDFLERIKTQRGGPAG